MNKKLLMLVGVILGFALTSIAQVEPTNSPYASDGSLDVTSELLTDASPNLLTFRPSTGGDYPILIFQPGANGFGEDNIDVNTYDLYMEHLASYGYVVVVIDDMQGGPNNSLFEDVHDRVKGFVADNNHWMSSMVDLDHLIVGGHSNGGLNASELIVSRPDEVEGIVYFASYPNPGLFAGIGATNVTDYDGNVLLVVGDEDETSVPLAGSTNEVALEAYEDRFENANCKTFIELEGVGHGGFGDYTHSDHTVGTIGRLDVTATVRHYLVSFMERTTKNDAAADAQFMDATNRLNPVSTFLTDCTLIDGGGSVSTNETTKDVLTVYPNPVANTLFFDVEGQEELIVVVYDLSGKVVMNEQVTTSLDVSQLSEGSYTIVVNNTFKKLFIKQ